MDQTPHVVRTVLADAVVATPVGEFDLAWAETLRDELLSAVRINPRVVVDLQETSFLDSTAIGALVSAHRAALDGGGWVRLVAPRPHVLKVLQVTELDSLLGVRESVEDALQPPAAPAPDVATALP